MTIWPLLVGAVVGALLMLFALLIWALMEARRAADETAERGYQRLTIGDDLPTRTVRRVWPPYDWAEQEER